MIRATLVWTIVLMSDQLDLCGGQQQRQIPSSDFGYTDECPQLNGFYADAVQCDRYYECKDGQILDKLCPDGLVYDENSIGFARCSFPFSIDCSDRPELQSPVSPSTKCPRQNGYFAHEDPKVCDKFYFCVDGVANEIICPQSLIFSPKLGQCAYSDQVLERSECSSEELYQFKCSPNPEAVHEHPRYPDPNDCQFFYICINGVDARRNGCSTGLVFDPDTLGCRSPQEVKGTCRNWYGDVTLNSEPTTIRSNPKRVLTTVRRRKPLPVVKNSLDNHKKDLITSIPKQPSFVLASHIDIQRFRDRLNGGNSPSSSRLTILNHSPKPKFSTLRTTAENNSFDSVQQFTNFRSRRPFNAVPAN